MSMSMRIRPYDGEVTIGYGAHQYMRTMMSPKKAIHTPWLSGGGRERGHCCMSLFVLLSEAAGIESVGNT